jgi:PIN domain nuclease of toxin-antitoxin system
MRCCGSSWRPPLNTSASSVSIDPTNDIEVSPATYGERTITISLGKYVLPEPYDMCMARESAANDCHILPIAPTYTAVLTTLPLHHRDSCDRLLIARAIVKAIPMLRCCVSIRSVMPLQ